jgi:hypothetical protein
MVPAADSSGLTREQVERLRRSATANAAGGGAPHAEFRARENARRKRARTMAAVLGWATGAFIFASVATGVVIFREQVAAAWPQTASAYRLVGLNVNRYGLELTGVTARRSFSGTTPVLTVTGAAVNTSDRTRPAPELRFSLRNEAGQEIQSWTDRLPVQLIAPGASVEFSSSLTSPPVDTFGLKVTFTGRPGAEASAGADVGHDQIGGADDHAEPGAAGGATTPEESAGPGDEAAGDLPMDGSGDEVAPEGGAAHSSPSDGTSPEPHAEPAAEGESHN